MSRIRVGMIGLGRFAAAHARIWSQLVDVEVVALCDPNPQAFEPLRQLFPDAACFADWGEMLREAKLDAVDVLTPEHLHAEPVMAALTAGLDVFVEKPLAASPDEAERLARTAEALGRVLMVGHVLRFDARYAEAKARVARGELGNVRSIYAKRNNARQYFGLYNRISPVFILGIHDIDLMRWLLDDEVEEVRAVRGRSGHETEDLIWAMLRFRRGSIGILENNWLLPGGSPSFMDVRMEITGEQGMIVVRDPEGGISVTSERGMEQPSLLSGFETHGKVWGPLADELAHFAACVRAGSPSGLLRPYDAWQAVRVAEAVRESARCGAAVQLKEAAAQ